MTTNTTSTPTYTTLTVLIEKPLTPTYAEAIELIDLAKEKNLILAPFQNRRWDADFLAVKGLLQEEKVRSDDFTRASPKRRG
jgi:predicted dehydrogenase